MSIMVPLTRKKFSVVIIFFLIGTGTFIHAQQRSSLTTIFLVRHAEKDTMKSDPPLTAKGRERSVTLARLVRNAGISTVYTTQYIRTQQTVKPLCDSLDIRYTVMETKRDSLERDARTLIDDILTHHRGASVLIAGHSNTIPLIIKTFGITEAITINDDEYDNLFIVTIAHTGEGSLVRLKFGNL